MLASHRDCVDVIEALEERTILDSEEIRSNLAELQDLVRQKVLPAISQLEPQPQVALERLGLLESSLQEASARAQEQEVRVDFVRAKLDGHDQRLSSLGDRLERFPSWDQISTSLKEERKRICEMVGVEPLAVKLDTHEQQLTELCDRVNDIDQLVNQIGHSIANSWRLDLSSVEAETSPHETSDRAAIREYQENVDERHHEPASSSEKADPFLSDQDNVDESASSSEKADPFLSDQDKDNVDEPASSSENADSCLSGQE